MTLLIAYFVVANFDTLDEIQATVFILYNYINESASINSFDMRAIHLSCPIITTSPLKNAKKLK
jgi:hypothetical protein